MKYTLSAMLKDPFAARVEVGMSGRGLTLRGFCREVGLDPSFFSKVLAGKRSPPSEESVLRRIAQVLGLDAVELIVSAGRIPSEWQALWDDPELLREIDRACAGGRMPAGLPSAKPMTWMELVPNASLGVRRIWAPGAVDIENKGAGRSASPLLPYSNVKV